MVARIKGSKKTDGGPSQLPSSIRLSNQQTSHGVPMIGCFICSDPLEGENVIRILQGGVTYEKWGYVFRSPEPFRNGKVALHLCIRCAIQRDLYVNVLDHDACFHCNNPFEPMDSPGSERILEIKRGRYEESEKGLHNTLRSTLGGLVHFNCAQDAWDLPLWDIMALDVPA